MADMARTDHPAMSEAEFFAWLEGQEFRHELVDGQPVMMAGTDLRHGLICRNVYAALRQHLRGSKCRAFMADIAVRIPVRNIRYPDVVVTCTIEDQAARVAENPVLLVEVLSPSTRVFDQTGKLEEYKLLNTLRHILHIDPDAAQVRLFDRRDAGAWISRPIVGMESSVEFSTLGLTLALSDIYEDVELRPISRLVTPEDRS